MVYISFREFIFILVCMHEYVLFLFDFLILFFWWGGSNDLFGICF